MSDPGELSPSTPASAPSSAPASSSTWAAERAAQQRDRHTPAPPRREQPANPNARVAPAWSDGRDAQSRHRLAAEARATEADDPAAPPAAARSADTLADNKVKIGDLELGEDEVRGLLERKGAEDSKRLTLPPTPADYKLDLPEDFRAPPGVEFAWQTEDPVIGPMIGAARDFAHEAGLTQPQFSKMMSLYAASKIQETAAFNAARRGEVAKFGAAATQRVDAVTTWMRGALGSQAADLARVLQMVPLASTVAAFETLIQRLQTQGSGAYTPTGRRVDGGDGKIPGYDSMTFVQRRAAQDDLNSRRR